MPEESPLHHLNNFLPDGCIEDVLQYLNHYKVHLTITKNRNTILGNYRNKLSDKNHRITVNGNLNKYSFLITLLHELAHLLAHEIYGHRIQPHGVQWKKEYAKILSQFIQKKIFPADVENTLLQTLQNPGASSCADVNLTRVLKKYDERKDDILFVEDVAEGTFFKIKGGRVFKKGERIRKRFKCLEISTGKFYLFSPVYEVKIISPKN